MSPLIEKLHRQLAQLEQQIRVHDANLSDADKKWFSHKQRFHDQLFEQQGASLSSCLTVLKQDLEHIEQLERLNAHADALELACQRFANRFAALAQAMATTATARRGHQATARRRQTKKADNPYHWIAQSVMRSSHQLYEELRKHQNWAARMESKIRELEQQLDLKVGAEKITLQNEILSTHKRLGRCRQAMSFIEQRIAQMEKTGS